MSILRDGNNRNVNHGIVQRLLKNHKDKRRRARQQVRDNKKEKHNWSPFLSGTDFNLWVMPFYSGVWRSATSATSSAINTILGFFGFWLVIKFVCNFIPIIFKTYCTKPCCLWLRWFTWFPRTLIFLYQVSIMFALNLFSMRNSHVCLFLIWLIFNEMKILTCLRTGKYR